MRSTQQQLREAWAVVEEAKAALRAVCGAYLTFALERPALYQAMFILLIDVRFASENTPHALKAAFGELESALKPFDAHPELRAEVTWYALHGLAVLRRGGRVPPECKIACNNNPLRGWFRFQ